ncbi:MAG: 50S ribosomal protein L29 [Nanoarchaeota archaeon]|nr:50S ribosomal protein L29 [Nanoarchaeota archaeon]
MAKLKSKDIERLSKNEREDRIKELRIELIKNKVAAKAKTNVREIKRAIARILTFNRLNGDLKNLPAK